MDRLKLNGIAKQYAEINRQLHQFFRKDSILSIEEYNELAEYTINNWPRAYGNPSEDLAGLFLSIEKNSCIYSLTNVKDLLIDVDVTPRIKYLIDKYESWVKELLKLEEKDNLES